MAAGGKTPARSGRRGRRGGRGWSQPRRNKPPSSPDAAAAAASEDASFSPGAEVEVRVDDDGFHGSWFEATVADFSPARGRGVKAGYTVEYSHLLNDEGGGVLAEHFPPSKIRPRPPSSPQPPSSFRLHDIVEAFHKDGWWSGIVAAAPDATVTVAFPITREVISFQPNLVRPRLDYVAGEWIPSRAVIAVKPKRAVKEYEVGEKVEVVRDREVYGYSWFPATVTKVIDSLSYIVEYFGQEVEGDDGAEKATEYLHWRFLRPAVEHVPLQSEFQLGPGAAVEAYCDGAWSPGIVRWLVRDDEYDVSLDGKNAKVQVTKVAKFLKSRCNWNGIRWKIASAKRQANLKRRSMSGGSPSSPVVVASSGDEHSHDCGSSDINNTRSHTKRPRKELVLDEDLVDVPISEKQIPVTVINQENPSEMLLDSQLDTPTCGTGAGNACATLSIAQRNKMASAQINSAGQQTQVERPLSIMPLEMKNDISNSERERTHPIQEIQGNHDASDNCQLNNSWRKDEVIGALTASIDCQASSPPDKQVPRQIRYKTFAIKKGSKELSSPHSSLDVDRTAQHRGRENLDLGRPSEDTYQELLPLIPPGFESIHNAKGIASRNGNVSTDHAAIHVANSSQLLDGPMLSLDCPIQQVHENYQNAGSSHSVVDNSNLRRCSIPSNLTLSQKSGNQVSFIKELDAWPTIEASDVFKLVPQQPHFSPLQKYLPELREGFALGHMAAFRALVERIMKASIEESMEFFEGRINALCCFEYYGFNVQSLKTMLTTILQLKSNCSKYLGEVNKLGGEIVEKTRSRSRRYALLAQKDEAMSALEVQVAALQQKIADLRQEAQEIENFGQKEDEELTELESKRKRFEELIDEEKRRIQNLLDNLGSENLP